MTGTHHPEAAPNEREQLELELLVARCQLGEPSVFDELVAGWHEPLWRYLRPMVTDPAVAEEVLQDAWLRILRGIDRLREPLRLRAWLFSIARRAWIDRLRARYVDSVVEPIGDEPTAEEPPTELEWEDSARLRRALQTLSAPDRETVVLVYFQELELREVAEVLGIPVGTVKSRLHRARRLLRAELEAGGPKP